MNKVEKNEFIIYFISIIYMKYKLFVIFFTFLNILSITFDHHVLAEETKCIHFFKLLFPNFWMVVYHSFSQKY